MSSRGWLTPDTLPSDVVCRTLKIPDELYLIVAVSGALLDLTYPDNWEQFGDQTPQDTADAMYAMLRDFWVSQGNDCVDISVATCIHSENQNVGGGTTPAANTDARIPFKTFVDHPSWIGLSSNIFTIQQGRYYFDMTHLQAQGSGFCWCWLANESGYPTWFIWGNQIASVTDRTLACRGFFDAAEEFKFGFWYRSNSNAVTNNGFGAPKNISGYNEYYGHLTILRIGETLL